MDINKKAQRKSCGLQGCCRLQGCRVTVSCQMFWEAVRMKGLGRRKTVDQTVTRAACLFQYSLNEKKMLQLRTEMVSLVRTGPT